MLCGRTPRPPSTLFNVFHVRVAVNQMFQIVNVNLRLGSGSHGVSALSSTLSYTAVPIGMFRAHGGSSTAAHQQKRRVKIKPKVAKITIYHMLVDGTSASSSYSEIVTVAFPQCVGGRSRKGTTSAIKSSLVKTVLKVLTDFVSAIVVIVTMLTTLHCSSWYGLDSMTTFSSSSTVVVSLRDDMFSETRRRCIACSTSATWHSCMDELANRCVIWSRIRVLVVGQGE